MKVYSVDIGTLMPDPKNARRHSKKNIEAIKNSLTKFGQQKPVVISDKNQVIAGNGTVVAAKELGWKTINVVKSDLDNKHQKAFAIADNRTAELAEWDTDILEQSLAELEIEGFDVCDIGFDDKDWDNPINKSDGITDDDAVSEIEQNIYGVQLGDIFVLGNHRLMCGSSIDPDNVRSLMDGNYAEIMMTDPPYGVKLDQSWRDKALGSKARGAGNKNIVQNDDVADWSEAWKLFDGSIAYIWHADKFTDVVMNSMRNVGIEPCQQIIWNKSIMIMGRCDYHFKHEPCWYGVRKGSTHKWIGDRKQTTIIEAPSPNHIMSGSKEEKTSHPTQKPVACMELIVNHEGDVYEPFAGSGTTLIACQKHNKKCYAMELSPIYCSIIIKRWEDFTGNKAIKLN